MNREDQVGLLNDSMVNSDCEILTTVDSVYVQHQKVNKKRGSLEYVLGL